jgi:putative transposase
MARRPRLAIAGQAHHLLQRGHNGQAVFSDEGDCQQYLSCLHAAAREHRVQLHAYALMPDHVHLLVTPDTAAGVSKLMQSLGRRYVVWFNQRHGRSGTLWEGRFQAAVVQGDRHVLDCQCFIESNPVRSGLVSDLLEFAWTSAAHHLGRRQDAHLTDARAFWRLGNTPFERQARYQQRLAEGLSDSEVQRLQTATRQGGVYGDAEFIRQLSAEAARPLISRPRGRPPRGGTT